MVTHRRAFHDVPPHWFVSAALAKVQQVVHNHLPNQVVAGEAVKIVDREVKLAGVELVQRHAELERLIEHGVQRLSVHLQTVKRKEVIHVFCCCFLGFLFSFRITNQIPKGHFAALLSLFKRQ